MTAEVFAFPIRRTPAEQARRDQIVAAAENLVREVEAGPAYWPALHELRLAVRGDSGPEAS